MYLFHVSRQLHCELFGFFFILNLSHFVLEISIRDVNSTENKLLLEDT